MYFTQFFKHPLTCTLVLVLPSYSTNVLANFNNLPVNVSWEEQQGAVVKITDSALTHANDTTQPDLANFHASVGDKSELWDVDFMSNTLTVTYTSINQNSEYMYDTGSFIGFHFQDTNNSLPDFTNVIADIGFAPFGLDPSLIRFDANNIWIDLQGSMCHATSMPSMPSCVNAQSPTKYNNFIKLRVDFASTSTEINNTQIDALFDWAEREYPSLFTSHQKSMVMMGYYAREYTNNTYLGTKDGRIWLYSNNALMDLGSLAERINMLKL